MHQKLCFSLDIPRGCFPPSLVDLSRQAEPLQRPGRWWLGRCCYQTPALKMTHVWAKSMGSLCSGFCSESCCKQGIDFYNHFWKFLFVSPWQFLAVWHHPNVTVVISLSLYALCVPRWWALFSRSCPCIFWDCSELCCIYSLSYHPLEGCKEEINQEERKKKLNYDLDFYIGIWETGWSSAEIGIDL